MIASQNSFDPTISSCVGVSGKVEFLDFSLLILFNFINVFGTENECDKTIASNERIFLEVKFISRVCVFFSSKTVKNSMIESVPTLLPPAISKSET